MDFLNFQSSQLKVICPKHGIHDQYIQSTIKGNEGHWCMLCWLETLGDSLETIEE